jgi:TRAP-type mannitol/chloroaromatic compound transport system permease large subunit
VSLTALGEKMVAALPPAFLLLVLLNMVFLGVAAWTFSLNVEARNAMLTKIIDNCLLQQQQQNVPPTK